MIVVTFLSTSQAMRAERTAKNAGLEVKLIPTPRHVSADCGTALRCRKEDQVTIQKLFEEHSVDYSEIAPI